MSTTRSTQAPRRPHRRRALHAVALLLALALVAVACGSDGGASTSGQGSSDGTSQAGGGGTGELVKINQGVVSGGGLPAVYAAYELGYFAEEGIDLELFHFDNGPALISALIGGSTDITHADIFQWATALTDDRDLYVIAGGSKPLRVDGNPQANSRLVVAEDSDIRQAKDLEGRKISVVASPLQRVSVILWLEAQGVDPDKVEFEILNDQNAVATALRSGDVDAAVAGDLQYLNLQADLGVRILGWLFEDFPEGATFTGIFSTGEFIKQDPDLIEGYVRAFRRGAKYFNEEATQEERAALVTKYFPALDFTVLKQRFPSILDEFNFNYQQWEPLDLAATQRWIDIGSRWGGVPEQIDVSDHVWPTAVEASS